MGLTKRLFEKNPIIFSLGALFLFTLIMFFAVKKWASNPPVIARSYIELKIEYSQDTDQDEIKIYINDSIKPFRYSTAENGIMKLTLPLRVKKISRIRIDPSFNPAREFKIHEIAIFSRPNPDSFGNAIPLEVFRKFSNKNPKRVQFSNLEQISENGFKTSNDSSTINIYPKKSLSDPQPWRAFLFNNLEIFLIVLVGLIFKFTLFGCWKSVKLDQPTGKQFFNFSKYECGILVSVFLITCSYFFITKPFIQESYIELRGIAENQSSVRVFWEGNGKFDNLNSTTVQIKEGGADITLPYLSISSVKLTPNLPGNLSANLVNSDQRLPLEVSGDGDQIIKIPPGINKKFNFLVCISNVLAALLATLLISAFYASLKNRQTLPAYIAYKERFIFISFFLFSLPFYLFWIVGQWPGALTHDSVYIWNSAITQKMSDDHPVMNYLFYAFLRQIYDSPGIVGIVQGVAFAAMTAYGCYVLRRSNSPYLIIIMSWLLLCVSLPAGLYIVTLWKDIPFTISIITWAFFIYRNYLSETKKCELPFPILLLLAFSTLGLYFRPGGWILSFILIVILWTLDTLKKKSLYRLLGCFLSIFILIEIVAPKLFFTSAPSGPFYKGLCLLNPMGAFYSNNYYTPTPIADKKAFEKFFPTTEGLKQYLAENMAPLHMQGVNNGVTDKEIGDISRAILRASILNPGIFLSDRIKIFSSTLLEMRANYYGLTHYNLLENNALKIVYPSINLYHYLGTPPFKDINLRQIEMIEASHRLGDIFEGKHLHWNTLIQFILLVAAILLARWLPATALFASITLLFAGVVFLTIPTNNWRYLFFLYVGGFFIIPLWIGEILTRLRKIKNHRDSSSFVNSGLD